jgi:two-component system, cell cycle sensor histidine kinase and response regulator CckA
MTLERQPAARQRGSETILLCEDQEDVRHATARILIALGYDVLVAGGGQEALLLAEAWPGTIHLLVTDVVMPGMSGPGLARRLARHRPGMKVLFLSGYPDEPIVRQEVQRPGNAFLQKPFTPEVLSRSVREVLDAPRGFVR